MKIQILPCINVLRHYYMPSKREKFKEIKIFSACIFGMLAPKKRKKRAVYAHVQSLIYFYQFSSSENAILYGNDLDCA